MNDTIPRIICTLGTTTDEPSVLEAMADAGMGMARINTAYATVEEMARRVDRLRSVSAAPVMLDLKGSQLRIDCTTDREDPVTSERRTVPCRYPISAGELIYVGFKTGPVRFNHDFEADLRPGDLVTFDNGRIRTRVADPGEEDVDPVEKAALLTVLDPGAGSLTPGMGANVPNRFLHVDRLTRRDRSALAMGVEKRVEWYALSFTREAEDVDHLHEVLAQRGDRAAGVMVKIEERHGLRNLERIAAAARRLGRPFSVMVARGDLFVELPPVKLPGVQRELIRRCRTMGAPVIVATGLLLSMQDGPRPARSEVCDVAAALDQGADSLMLSDETSNGRNPALAVEILADLIAEYGAGWTREEAP